MKKLLLLTALACVPAAAFSQTEGDVQVKKMIDFDADGDGVMDRVGILTEGCEGDECPVELFTAAGSILLGYGKTVETGFVSPEQLGVNDPSAYPANVPVIQIDGVLMAFNGQSAYPVADMISKDALTPEAVTNDDLAWIRERLNADIKPEEVFKATGDLSPAGGDIVYSVSTLALGNTSAWFLREGSGAEAARGFSMDYPRIYQNGDDLRIISVSQSGLGVMDVSFAPAEG